MRVHRTVPIQEFCQTGSGTTPSRKKQEAYYGGTVPWVKSGELREGLITTTEEHVTEQALRETPLRLAPKGALLVAMYGATVGRVARLGLEATTNQAVCHIIPDPKLADEQYLFHALQAKAPELIARGVGGAQPNISQGTIKGTAIYLPPLPEQRRIAAILDQADTLRRLRRQSLSRLSDLGQAIFLEMFGDPARNPIGFRMRPLRDVASKFSDGPFGSNLKSAHYVDDGVRVIRLQNIGVNEFVDNDRAYIAPEHFASLRKHECLPGDILVGTLGDPNLRACIQPEWLEKALNKADCVQIRVDDKVASNEYVCALLNIPSVEKMAHSLVLGQTRARISMGRLRDLHVPIAPKDLQDQFASVIAKQRLKIQLAENAARSTETLFASLQHRAFRGEM